MEWVGGDDRMDHGSKGMFDWKTLCLLKDIWISDKYVFIYI